MSGSLAIFPALILSQGCTAKQSTSTGPAGIAALTTISTFDSFAKEVGGERVAVRSLVPIGASPEDYQPTPLDVAKLHDAAILFENGVGLETWLARTIANASNEHLKRVLLTGGLVPIANNPHLWMDPEFARTYVRNVERGLAALDPAGTQTYAANAASYDARLVALQRDIARRIQTIPPARRAMITYHNAFDYYNRRFGLQTLGVIERSPGQEPSPSDLAALVRLAREHQVPVIFTEPQFSAKLANALAQSAGIKLVTNLYSDTVGSDPALSDYEGISRYNTETIVRALGGQPS